MKNSKIVIHLIFILSVFGYSQLAAQGNTEKPQSIEYMYIHPGNQQHPYSKCHTPK